MAWLVFNGRRIPSPPFSSLSTESFTFVVNGLRFPVDASIASAISPAVALQLLVDSLARTFSISDPRINASDFSLLLKFFSGASVSFNPLHHQSLLLLAQRLFNSELEQLFFDFSSQKLDVLSDDALSAFLSNEIAIDSEDSLLDSLLALDDWTVLDCIHFNFLSSDGIVRLLNRIHSFHPSEALLNNVLTHLWRLLASVDSQIISELPPLFNEFRYKRCVLLWRGSRDGFSPAAFHSRCDGHSNTLTLIQDTKGNAFGGFTPVAWESRVWNNRMWAENNCPKADLSGKTFIFTLVNPWDVPPTKFGLRAGWEKYAIYCDAAQGPVFGVEADITVRAHCAERETSFTRYFGNTYVNDTGLGGPPGACTFLTGSELFKVKEIEVFEVIGE